MQAEIKNQAGDLFANTTPADDVDALINIVKQMEDHLTEDQLEMISTQAPDPTKHCKNWQEVNATTLCNILEAKYKHAMRLPIPQEHLTEY